MRLGPIVGLFVFVGVVGACLEIEAEPTTVLPSSTVEVSITTKALAPVVLSSEMATTPTTEVLGAHSIKASDDEPVEDIDCDDAENLCETGAYNCDDIADYCDYGPDDGQDLPDEFDWDE
jgi:hypothetical protein